MEKLISDGISISLMQAGEQRDKALKEFRNSPAQAIWEEVKSSGHGPNPVLVFREDVFLEENTLFGFDLSTLEWELADMPEQTTTEEAALDALEG